METNKEQDKTLMRAEFEEWAMKDGYKIHMKGNQKAYPSAATQSAWEAWQAALSQRSEAMNVNYTAADCGCAPNEACDICQGKPTPAQGDAVPDGPTEAEYAAVFADDVLDEVMKERDHYHDVADGLADAIAKYFGAEIGEHSSSNCPWDEAMRVIEESNDYQQFPNATRQSSADAGDAARYRELRKDSQMYYVAYRNEGMGWAFSQINMDKLDKYIDAAIAAQGGKGE